MHLTPRIRSIDTGIDVGIPYWGNAPDLGAFETITGTYHINKPPVVSIAFSAKGSSFTAPATVEVNIEASDPDGAISRWNYTTDQRKLQNPQPHLILSLSKIYLQDHISCVQLP